MNYNFTICESTSYEMRVSPLISNLSVQQETQKTDISVKLFCSIENVPKDWDELLPESRNFLHTPFLRTLETKPPQGMQFGYLMFFKKKQPIGLAVCQILHFNADQSINEQENQEKGVFSSVGRYFKEFVAKRVDFKTLVCGNLLLTGEHGYYFDSRYVEESESLHLLADGLDKAANLLREKGIDTPITLIKDYYETSRDRMNTLTSAKYHEFCIQPSMLLKLRPEWENYTDYLAAMSSKYRVRAKRARKKGAKIVRKTLNLDEIRQNNERIYELYLSVVNNSGFNTLTLHPEYFLGLKENLGETFQLTAYYIDNEMVAFFTTIKGTEEMEAHFLGYDSAKNHEHQIYLNILYDIVDRGISYRTKEINFARTALEIKSSVGAVGHEMYCYIKHRSSFPNIFVKNLFDYLNKPEEWKPRHPFK